MTGLPFSQPSSAGGGEFEPKNHNGRLLLIYPKSYNPNATTKFGPSQSADVDVIVVDQPDPETGQPIIAHDARLFGNLAKSVRNDLGGVVLGRLGQVPTNNGNPAWVLNPYEPQDAQMAGPVDQQYKAGQFKQPAPAAPTQTQVAPPVSTTHDPWAGMQTTPTPPATPAVSAQPYAAPQPVQGQWQQAPTPTTAAPPTPAAQSAAPTVDPNLVAFLQARGVQVTPQMDQATCEAIARSFPQ